MKGMTGFGSAEFSNKYLKITAEIKSVNHRYLDVNYYLPNAYNSLEHKFRTLIKEDIHRGRFIINVRLTNTQAQAIKINEANIKQYLTECNRLQQKYNVQNDVSLSHLISLPGSVEVIDSTESPQAIQKHILKTFKQALKQLMVMRNKEGIVLKKDITAQAKEIQKLIKSCKKEIQVDLKQKKAELEPDEFTAYQKGSDINEEIVRLDHFQKQLLKKLTVLTPVGKTLDFICQEMNREVNTIGSKTENMNIMEVVIQLKNKVEKIREQSQNVE